MFRTFGLVRKSKTTPNRASRENRTTWEVSQLEHRTLLDAAGGAAIAQFAAASAAATQPLVAAAQPLAAAEGHVASDMIAANTLASSLSEGSAVVAGTELAENASGARSAQAELAASNGALVFIDSRLEELGEIAQQLPAGAELVVLDAQQDGLAQMARILRHRKLLTSVHILAHGASGELQLGNGRIDLARISADSPDWQAWRGALAADADVLIYGCDVAAGPAGKQFVAAWAAATGADVAASHNRTGHARQGGDWELEVQAGLIEASLIVSATTQQTYRGILPITVYAAGATGQEQMQLLVDDTVVQTWDNVGGNYSGGVFQAFTWTGGNDVTPDRVRVAFSNDLYDPSNGIDRNLRVDRIVVNGAERQTEDPSVWSSGTNVSPEGTSSAFVTMEYLFTNGFFQYDPGIKDQTVTIRAAGATGQETMELWINDAFAQTWTNVSTVEQDYVFVSPEFVLDASQVRIAFTNDAYDPATGLDRNLRVNRMTIGHGTYETEAPDVFSTGTYLAADGIVPGFRQSETLNANGFFDYQAPLNATPITIRAHGTTGTEAMQFEVNGVPFKTWDELQIGTGFQNYVFYDYSNSITANDVRVSFFNDLYDPANNFDRNLVIDYLSIGDVIYETESPSVYSTGTWDPVNGLVPGFPRSEVLHVDGYFEYSDGAST